MRRPVPIILLALLLALTVLGIVTVRLVVYEFGGPTAKRKAVTVPPVDGVRITSMTVYSGRLPPCPEPAFDDYGHHDDPVIRPLPTGGPGISATYELHNEDTEVFTYTIRFMFLAGTIQVGAFTDEVVRSVRPGATVRGTVQPETQDPYTCPVTRVKVAEVTKVPDSELPPPPERCPPSGLRLTSDHTAAMGLRVVGLHLQNCGTDDYALDGYPLLELLDTDRSPVDGARITHGSGGVSGISLPGSGFDEPAHPLVLKPGESAVSELAWRTDTPIVPYLRVRAQPDAAPVTLTLRLDLGTTGTLAVSPWKLPP
ncbi:Protein of unknown function (DUF4232) [Parafrankia irregularis]|uniref:DUF4232 domain-containing protein n=1 Tax=Parafrankia irregularis TaxID=795642 RepID=A0A0S4QNC9_9ACTN|nr:MULTISPECIES: DUF4232 domain-containing protein [Parafrankia]MBE3201158.1 DUF4232 domain-containing protein [Parafrankia sp. CH37]CUU56408.1 Protein of unknown function (DUF4232) [Parafrankia irregularis]